MCGISGAISNDAGGRPVDQSIIAYLNDLQASRGPDGSGLWASPDGQVVLGHRRLAIIDTGASGAQPMFTEDRRWVITFNGEIYNYRQLRAELEAIGYRFFTNSDTEVLINTVAEWGEVGLSKLNGMFAFALWDSLSRELWLARDPYGIKPLYIAEVGNCVWFASQVRPLARVVPGGSRPDVAGATGFYLWGHVPEPFTWWHGIRMFPPGHVQRIRERSTPSSPRPFNRIEEAFVSRQPRRLQQGELRELLLEVVRFHLVADIPVGVFLSAGIDSNVIAALAAEVGSPGLRTFTLAFDEYVGTPYDEAPLAESAASKLGSDHVTVRMGRDLFESLLDDFLNAMDQPTIDGLNIYLVSRAARMQGLKVALSGLGGDELFGGYPSFRQIPNLIRFGQPLPFRAPLAHRVRNFMRALPGIRLPPKLPGLLSHTGDVEHAYLLRRALYLEDELEEVLDAGQINAGLDELSTITALAETLKPLRNAHASTYAQIAALESCWYMRNQLLRDADWASMAHSVEVRVPFASQHLIERLGPAIASEAPPRKQDLAACAVNLPRAVRNRPKTGFTTPVGKWLEQKMGHSMRGLRGWASFVHRHYCRAEAQPVSEYPSIVA